MKHKKLNEALNEISDLHIAEAAAPRKKHIVRWVSAVAAVLALVLTVNLLVPSMLLQAKAVATASHPRQSVRPDRNDYKTYEEYRPHLEAYLAEQDARHQTTQQANTNLADFFLQSSQLFLADPNGENRVWSPINGYIALAMLAEVTDGNSRAQILELLNTADLETLRAQVSAVWESVYQDNGKEICTLANSLWLDQDLTYRQTCMDALAYHYYASVYKGDFGSTDMDNALRTWINKSTGSLLKDSADNLCFTPDTVLSLASTVYLQSKWVDDFSKSQNTTGLFHSPAGDINCTFMNKKLYQTYYYWGESYGAISLSLENGCRMWFFLPDDGKQVSDILSDGEYLQTLSGTENSKYMKVNLSVPKFDVSSAADLSDGLQQLGITDVFDQEKADFSASLEDCPAYVDAVQQAARVTIDEEGVTAASYIVIIGAGAAQPPEEIIDFILDRPFLFVIESEGLPLFTGVVNTP